MSIVVIECGYGADGARVVNDNGSTQDRAVAKPDDADIYQAV